MIVFFIFLIYYCYYFFLFFSFFFEREKIVFRLFIYCMLFFPFFIIRCLEIIFALGTTERKGYFASQSVGQKEETGIKEKGVEEGGEGGGGEGGG